MISGSPPTDRNARTGLFTPPTSTFSALSKISRDRRRSGFIAVGVALMQGPLPSGLQPARGVFRVVGQNRSRTGPLNPRQNLQDNSLFVDPALLGRGFHHGIFTADVVSRHRHIEVVPYRAHNIEIR